MAPNADDPQRSLFLSVVANAIPRIAQAIDSKHYLTRHEYVKIKTRPSGIPDFSTASDGPVDVGSLFRRFGDHDPDIDESTIPGFDSLIDLIVKDDCFVEVFGLPNSENENYTRMFASGVVLDVIEGVFHRSRTRSAGEIESLFNDVYDPIARFVRHQSLVFDLGIPIMFTLFDEPAYEFDDRVSIEEMSEQLHRQRAAINSYSPATATPVISGSTHMLRLKGYSLSDRWNMWLLSQRTHQIDLYPTDIIESFFLALDLAADVQTGYCQILSIPVNWTTGYSADRPYIYGAPTRLYPPYFDNYYWNQDSFPTISSKSIERG